MKSILGGKNNFCPRRPREGAWIEIVDCPVSRMSGFRSPPRGGVD